MRESDADQFATRLTEVLAIYQRSISKGVIGTWWRALKHFDFTSVDEALDKHVQNPDEGQYAPKPADIIKLLGGTSKDRALIAWADVQTAIGTVGGYNSVVFPDPLIHAVVTDMGGWSKLCQTEEPEMPFRGNEFQNRYRAYLFNPPSSYPQKLIGLSETTNSAGGKDVDPPIPFGDKKKCRVTFANGRKPSLSMGPALLQPKEGGEHV